ncbi:hypothetical protein H4R99_000878 [Coemansia sp. RSA 1722]|nr:hypothetical protein LPJ57_000350 [Coemansia sp. RSA 486]KAJ2237638.1 hypothetical protein IWW45_000740 [Coemansia sp. RSA 485]KAJ2601699.1 hypothetical protein GGF39_001100 [Coemansia sp. RSA 1721]KAJ2605784.1 hypothetical protein H4R99_000878 [Coemansia sp. RSA 1722]KAJ2639192.1 hypothetical protein GGF40_001054 [Coemansia sp. RSA 1286]
MLVSTTISPASASSLFARLNLGCIAQIRSLPRLYRNASILAHQKTRDTTQTHTHLQPNSSNPPNLRSESVFLDPLQFILKDTSMPRSQTASALQAESYLKTQRILDEMQAAVESATRNMAGTLSQGSSLSHRYFGTVVSDTCGAGGERTIEMDVTPAQLQTILMMQNKKRIAKRPAAAATTIMRKKCTTAAAQNALRHTNKDNNTALHEYRHASVCVNYAMKRNGSKDAADNTANIMLALAIATALLATSTSTAFGLQHEKGVLEKLQASEISNILNCS